MRTAPALALTLLLAAGCAEPPPEEALTTTRTRPPVTVKVQPPAPPVAGAGATSREDPLRYDRLARFTSAAAFRRHLRRLREARLPRRLAGSVGALGTDAGGGLGGLIGNQIGESYGVGGLGLVGTGQGGGGTGEGTIGLGSLGTIGKGGGGGSGAGYGRGAGSITNNQELGVDEGGIVKVAGDYLIILRRGRLFSVRWRDEAGRPTLRPAGRANAYREGASWGTWYDELLVRGRRIVVIGYSYRMRASEVVLFDLGADGRLRHRATHFLRSNDYYSTRNYASRLVGDRLLLYMPYYLAVPASGLVELPAIASWNLKRRRAGAWRTILREVDVYQPVQHTRNPTLHTVVSCDLERPELACSARAVIGPYARSFYVSRAAVYVWVGAEGGARARGEARASAYLYRMPLAPDGEVTAIRARGQPIDQLSFKESADGHINVLLTVGGGGSHGDWMAGPECARGQLALLRMPLWTFSAAPLAAPETAYTSLPGGTEGRHALHNRYVGDWLLWGKGAGWWRRPENGGTLHATHLRRPGQVERLPLDHGVDRIEPMGRNAVAVGSGKGDLFFSAVALGQRATVSNTWVRRDAAQGETRTHGFFFLPTSPGGGGMLGLPVRRRGRPGRHLFRGSAEVTFLRVSDELRFTPLGALTARAGRLDDRCRVSCVDWYGNARPIFIGGRVLALLGYELVEGALAGERLAERGRVRFLRPRR